MKAEQLAGEILDAATALAGIIHCVEEIIIASGDRGVPSGELYMVLAGSGMNYNTYLSMIDVLVKTGRITNSYHLLKGVKDNF